MVQQNHTENVRQPSASHRLYGKRLSSLHHVSCTCNSWLLTYTREQNIVIFPSTCIDYWMSSCLMQRSSTMTRFHLCLSRMLRSHRRRSWWCTTKYLSLAPIWTTTRQEKSQFLVIFDHQFAHRQRLGRCAHPNLCPDRSNMGIWTMLPRPLPRFIRIWVKALTVVNELDHWSVTTTKVLLQMVWQRTWRDQDLKLRTAITPLRWFMSH